MTIVINKWYMSLICRDVKPENILIDTNGHIKLGDFGVAATGFRPDRKRKDFCGTIPYMAPEVIITFCFKCYSFVFLQ